MTQGDIKYKKQVLLSLLLIKKCTDNGFLLFINLFGDEIVPVLKGPCSSQIVNKFMNQSIPTVNIPPWVTPRDSHILFAQSPGFFLKSFARGAGV